jgi:hypothetical protein
MRFAYMPLMLSLAACQAASNNQLDPGPAPTDYRSQINTLIKTSFKDPYSIKDSEISAPFLKEEPFRSNKVWYVCFRSRAKNSFGAYVGLKDTVIYFKDLKIANSIELDAGDIGCPGAKFTPWKPPL